MARLPLTLFCGLVALALLGCDGDDGNEDDLLAMLPLRTSIPAALNPILAHNFSLGEDIPTDHARLEAASGTPWEDWARVEPARATLVIPESGLDWGFALEVTLKGYRDDPSEQVELFYRDQIRDNVGGRLDLIPTEFDAKDLLGGDAFGLVLEIRRLRNANPQSFPVVLEYSWGGYR